MNKTHLFFCLFFRIYPIIFQTAKAQPHGVAKHFRRVTKGERGVVSLPFFKIKKSALIWGKNAMIILTNGLNFSFKMLF